MQVSKQGYEFEARIDDNKAVFIPEEYKVSNRVKNTVYTAQFGLAVDNNMNVNILPPCIVRGNVFNKLSDFIANSANPQQTFDTFLRSKKATYFPAQPGIVICNMLVDVDNTTGNPTRVELRLFQPYSIMAGNDKMVVVCKYFSTNGGTHTMPITMDFYNYLYRTIYQMFMQMIPERKNFIGVRI